MTGNEWDHVARIEIDVASDDAFKFMADARNISEWALGALYPIEATEGSYAGESMIDGQRVFIKIASDPLHRLIHFRTGKDWDHLEQVFECRIVAAEGPGFSCILSLSARRPSSMLLPRWKQLCASHEVEMFIIKNRIEAKR